MAAKKRLTMFDAMDGALSRIGGLSEAAEKARTLPFRLKTGPIPQADATDLPEPPEQVSRQTGQTNRAEQTNRADKPGRQTGQTNRAEQTNRADKPSRQTGQTNRADKPGRQTGQTNRADKPGRQTGQTNRADKPGRLNPVADDLPVRLGTRQDPATPAQQTVADYFAATGSQVTTYRVIAAETGVPYGTVRRVVDLFVQLGWLAREPWGQGRQRALKFLVLPKMTQSCPDDRADKPGRQTGQTNRADKPGRLNEQTNWADKPSRLNEQTYKDKIDRLKDLSISLPRELSSLTVIRTTWPNLARCGFGSEQVRQILDNLVALGKPTDRLVQGLDHLEYELATDQLRDKDGQPVADPCSWAFRALAQNGYYRRPKGYISPDEQAALDAQEEARAVIAARQQAEQAQFTAWRDDLSATDLDEAMRGYPGGPKDAWLKRVWKTTRSAGDG